jgi:hypothetical protein
MVSRDSLELHLTLLEAKALARLVNIAIDEIDADGETVSNPVTLQRSVEACRSALRKIETAICDAEPGAFSGHAP